MRQELRQLLTPRMIQSMEILQLPLMALEERIDQELENNPVLEMRENEPEADADGELPKAPEIIDEGREESRPMVLKENSNGAEDFDRLSKISEYFENEEFQTNSGNFRQSSGSDGERDKKLDAMNNTAARGISLTEYLMEQWSFVECSAAVRRAGRAIINFIDAEGYLRVTMETIQT